MIIGDLLYRGPLNIRRRLFRDVFGVVLVTVGALVALTLLQGMTVKDEISAQLISESNRIVKKRFSDYLDRCSTGLFLLARMGQSSLLDSLTRKELARVVIPVMDTYAGLYQVKIVDVAETGITFTHSASGYVPKILGKKELASIKNSELYTNVMAASGTNPVVWVNDVDAVSGITGLSAAIRVEQPHLERSLVIVFFIPASEIMTFITDIEVPDNVDIIFYNREGLFLSRKQLREKNDAVTGFKLMGRDEAPAETRKALSLWLSDGEDVQSVKKFMLNGITWWAGYSPLSDKNEFTWVSIVIPETDIVSDVKKQWIHLGVMAGGILLFAVLLTIGLVRKYGFQLKDLPHRQTIHASLTENVRKFITAGESPTVEFKSTMRTNLQSGKTGKEIELAWLKGVVAFMNTDGGIVLIGVSDSGEILGIDSDGFASEDKCSLHFKNLINTHLGAELARYVHLRFCSINEKTVLMIECERVREPVFLKVGKSEEFYVRSGPSSMKLTISQAVHYLARR